MNADVFSRKTLMSLVAALVLGTCAIGAWSTAALAVDVKVMLTGDLEVPAVKTAGTGSGFFAIANNNAITGSVNTAGISGTAAHIHEAAPGKSGPVIIPLTKNGDSYAVPEGTKFTATQLAAFKAGNLYVNVHTAANPGGELRGQLKP
jgi:CHRD domain